MSRVSPRDLYRLRKHQLEAERKAIIAQLAQWSLRQLMLELELRYDLLASEATLDVHTGLISQTAKEVNSEPRGHEGKGTSGPP